MRRRGNVSVHTVGDVLKMVRLQSRTGMLCFKLSGAKYLLNLYFSGGNPYAVSFGRDRGERALEALLRGSVESCHFVVNLSSRYQDVMPGFDSLVDATAKLPVASVDMQITGESHGPVVDAREAGSTTGALQSMGAEDQASQLRESGKRIIPSLPDDIPWE